MFFDACFFRDEKRVDFVRGRKDAKMAKNQRQSRKEANRQKRSDHG